MSMAMEGDQSLIDKVYIEAHTVMVYYYLDIL